MKSLPRTATSLGLLAALTSAASAAITFGDFAGNGAPFLSPDGPGLLSFNPNVADSGAGAYFGTFTVASDTPLTSVDVQVGSNLVFDGQLGFAVSLDGGTGFVYQDAVAAGDEGASLVADGGVRALGLRAYTVSYALTYAGGEGSFASFSNAAFDFHASPVPEPTALAALGLGLAGLVRRRKNR